jgi:hypothetical protein
MVLIYSYIWYDFYNALLELNISYVLPHGKLTPPPSNETSGGVWIKIHVNTEYSIILNREICT